MGCVERCELRNVGLIITGDRRVWLDRLGSSADYEAITAWAEASARARHPLPLPPTLQARATTERAKTTVVGRL